jgi:hypothetical protein
MVSSFKALSPNLSSSFYNKNSEVLVYIFGAPDGLKLCLSIDLLAILSILL